MFPCLYWGSKFDVRVINMEQFVVDIELRTCSCRKSKLCAIPCAHVEPSMGLDGKNPEDYVDPCYSKESFESI